MEKVSWITEQLTVLAEAFGESVTEARLDIYVQSLIDIPREKLAEGFKRALRETKFFPKISELRDLSGWSPQDQKTVEAQAAWKYVNEYLQTWGVDRLPVRSGGKWIEPPALNPRTEYALQQIGGLWRLNQITDESYPFVFRDFCAAYELAPVAERMTPQLSEQFSKLGLKGKVEELSKQKKLGGGIAEFDHKREK